jgi:hypothetical protein
MGRLIKNNWINFLVICVALVLICGGLFYCLTNLTKGAQESVKQIQIVPTKYSGAWFNQEKALVKDLGPEANFENFSAENSTFPIEKSSSPSEQLLPEEPPQEITPEEPPQENIPEEIIPETLPQESIFDFFKIQDLFASSFEENFAPSFVERVLEFSDFAIPSSFAEPTEGKGEKKIKNIQLRLSLGFGGGGPEDSLAIEYNTSELEDNWQSLEEFFLNNSNSNASNNGYWLYALPIFENWQDLENLKIRFRYRGFLPAKGSVYLDAVWLEVDYEEIAKETPKIIETQPRQIGERQNFRSDEEPEFATEGVFHENAGILKKLASVFSKKEITGATLINPRGEESSDGIIIENNIIRIKKSDQRSFRPGLYKLKIKAKEDEEEFIKEQEFLWGVLAINIDRSIELPGNDAYLQFGVLDDKGYTICNAGLDLSIQSPSGQTYEFTTKDGSITQEEICGPNNLIPVPDYYAHFSVPEELGVYSMILTGHTDNGDHTITDSFEVKQNVEFDVVRSGPTRINPSYQYPAILKIIPEIAWQGVITETVPVGFDITQLDNVISYSSIEVIGEEKIISWNLSLQAGTESKIGYYFDAPDISPEFYLLGPLTLRSLGEGGPSTVFQEFRQWQIASDATCTSKVGGGGVWNNTGSWDCGVVPTTTSNVVISTAQAITIDSAPNAVLNVVINSGATLNGGSVTLTITPTVASTTLFTNNGGTWNSGTGTVTFVGNVSSTLFAGNLTGSNKFNNINTNTTATPTGGMTYTAGVAVEIGGNWTSTPVSSSARDLTINLSGATTVTGTLTLSGTGCTSTTDTSASTTQFSTNGQSLTVGKIVVNGQTGGDNCQFTTSNSSVVTFTGTSGTLFTLGQSGSTAKMTTGTTTEWDVTSATGTPTLFSTSGTAITVHILKINSAATIINLGAAFTVDANSGNKLWIASGVLNQESRTITVGANATLQIDSGGTLCLGGTTASTTANCVSGAAQTTAQVMPVFATYTFDASSTVKYLSDAATTVSNTPTYGNLYLYPKFVTTARIYTLGGVMTINGDFTINPDESGAGTPALTVNSGGLITVAAGKTTTITRTNSATSSLVLHPVATDYNLTTGLLNIAAGGTLDGTNASSTITITGTGTTVFQNAGTYIYNTTKVSYTNVTSATILAMTGTGGTNGYYDLDTNGAGTFTLGGNTTINNVLSITAGNLTASTYTITIRGTGAAFINAGTFTASTGTVAYEGTGATTVLGLNAANHYYNLTLGLASDTNTFSFSAGGEIEASGSVTLIAGSSGVHTFDMSTYNLSVGGGAANTGGIAVPTRTAFTQTAGTTKVYSASGSATIGGAGTTNFYNFTIGNASDNASYTFNLGGEIGASGSFIGSAGGGGTHTLALSSYEFGVWGDWTMGGATASLSAQTGLLTFSGAGNTAYTNSGSSEPYNLTINKTTAPTDNVTLSNALTVRNAITIIDGRLVQGAQNIAAEGANAVSVGTNGEWRNIVDGDLMLGGTFDNAGSVSFDTNDSGCSNVADNIQITSTANGAQRTWSGTGGFTMYNVYVKDMTRSASPNITVYVGSSSNITGNWTFASCAHTPVIGEVTLNSKQSPIILLESGQVDIMASASITDPNGCGDISGVKAIVYRYDLNTTASCSLNYNNCYDEDQFTCFADGACAGNTQEYNCYASSSSSGMWYFADPTTANASASYANDQWVVTIIASDSLWDDTVSNSWGDNDDVVDVEVLTALEASSSINYGQINPGNNTGSSPIEIGIKNTGNWGIDTMISGTAKPTFGVNDIDYSNQKFASKSDDYSDEYQKILSALSTPFNVTIPKPTTNTAGANDVRIFWGMGVPSGKPTGSYINGINLFSPTSDGTDL